MITINMNTISSFCFLQVTWFFRFSFALTMDESENSLEGLFSFDIFWDIKLWYGFTEFRIALQEISYVFLIGF